MRKVAILLGAAALACGVVACVSDDTVQQSVDGGYFPSDAAPYDATLPGEDAGEDAGQDGGHDAGADAAKPRSDGGTDATADAAGDASSDGGSSDSGGDATD